MLNLIFLSICLLILWFNTDAFIVYTKLFRIGKLFKIDKYELYKKEKNPRIEYHTYLRIKYNNFITKLITCVPCINFWICLIIVLLFSNIVNFPFIYVVSLVIYTLITKYVL